MYNLYEQNAFRVSDPTETYIYDILPVAAGLVSISSDDCLRILDPLNLNGPPINSVRKINAVVTCLRAFGEGDAVVVATAGRDGRVVLMDPRSGAKVGEVRSGMSKLLFSKALLYSLVRVWSEFYSEPLLYRSWSNATMLLICLFHCQLS